MKYLLLSIVKVTALLPPGAAYAFSDCAAWFLKHIVGYRNKVISGNFKNAFPSLSKEQLNSYKSGFYRHFTDVFMEITRNFNFTVSQARQFTQIENPELIEQLLQRHKTIILVSGHQGNWEVPLSHLPLYFNPAVYALYKPLSSKASEFLINTCRTRFGVKMLPVKTATKYLLSHKDEKKLVLFIADQTPFPENACWTTFLNQDTPVFKGAEKISKKLNCPVVFVSNKKVKRGQCRLKFKLVTENPAEMKNEAITVAHTRLLEQDIMESPPHWLWSHRRWKHKKPSVPVN